MANLAGLASLASSKAPAVIFHGGLVLFANFALPPLVALLLAWRLLRLTSGEEQS